MKKKDSTTIRSLPSSSARSLCKYPMLDPALVLAATFITKEKASDSVTPNKKPSASNSYQHRKKRTSNSYQHRKLANTSTAFTRSLGRERYGGKGMADRHWEAGGWVS